MAMLLLTTCGENEPTSEGGNPVTDFQINTPIGKGFDLLSEYNFFVGALADLIPNEAEGVLPYDLNMALFSDYAAKKRFVYVPEGANTPFNENDVLDFPVGTVLIKHFFYLIPNQNQCKNCHDHNGNNRPIGPTAHNLNKDYSYSSGQTKNQLLAWQEQGILNSTFNGLEFNWPNLMDESIDLDIRARAYLDVNCSSCHSQTGSAENSGLYLEFENRDSLSLGIRKGPVAAGGGSGGFSFAIDPGNADESILLYRMISDLPDERMPEIGRSLLHDEGIELIRDWINSLD